MISGSVSRREKLKNCKIRISPLKKAVFLYEKASLHAPKGFFVAYTIKISFFVFKSNV
jgi:hypothetical protein